MRVALVLDNTRCPRKTAVAGTGGLIDQLSALSDNLGDIYISIMARF